MIVAPSSGGAAGPAGSTSRCSALLARTGALRGAAGGGGEGERSVVDDALHDDGRGEPLHAGQGGERLVAERRVPREVGGGDAQQVVRIAEHPFGVPDLGDGGERGFELG